MNMKLIRNAVLSIGLAVSAGSASALTQLGAALDGSGSVFNSDFILQLQGWADAVGNLPTDSSVEVTVVQFGTGPGAVVEVQPTLIDSPATRTAVQNSINAISQGFGGTPIDAGINTLVNAMTNSANWAGGANDSVINLATDGFPNNATDALNAALAAESMGIDALTAEAVGPNAGTAFLQTLVFNPTCAANSGCSVLLAADSVPPNPLTGSAWVLPVTNFNAFGAAIGGKVGAIVGVPEPQLLALLAIGLVGFGASAKRRARA